MQGKSGGVPPRLNPDTNSGQQMPGPALPDAHGTSDIHPPNQAAEHNLTNPERGVKSEIEQSPNGTQFFHRWGKNGKIDGYFPNTGQRFIAYPTSLRYF
jgi:hypothetical protein